MAAVSDRPVARRSKPKRVLLSTNQNRMPTMIARKIRPYTSRPVPSQACRLMPGTRESSARICVLVALLPSTFTAALLSM